MPTNFAVRAVAGVRCVAIAVAVAAPFAFPTQALADDFVSKCQAFATAANEGKAPANADKICGCIQGKLSASEQTIVLAALDELTAAGKAGKEPPEPTGDKKAALQKFSDAGDTCSKSAK